MAVVNQMPGLIPGFPLLKPDMEAKTLSKRPQTHAPILKRTLNDTVGIMEGYYSILRGREAVCPVAVVDNGAGQTSAGLFSFSRAGSCC